MMMRRMTAFRLTVACAAQAVVCLAQAQTGDLTLKIPPIKTSLDLKGQSVAITAWGTVSAAPAGNFRLALTADLGDFQEHLTPLLAAQLNQSDRCGDRLSLQKAVLVPAAPSSVLTANVYYERFVCVKALGKEIVKKLVGGNAEVEVSLTPSVMENDMMLAAQVRKINADGSLGELLQNGSLGNLLREKITAAIQRNIQQAVNRKTTLPPAIEGLAVLQSAQFADGGAGRLWLTIAGEAHLSAEQFRGMTKELAPEGAR
jgi:hypothetical protein